MYIFHECIFVQWEDSGRVQKVRGVAWSRKVNPTDATRALNAAKKKLNEFIADVYLRKDSAKGTSPGKFFLI